MNDVTVERCQARLYQTTKCPRYTDGHHTIAHTSQLEAWGVSPTQKMTADAVVRVGNRFFVNRLHPDQLSMYAPCHVRLCDEAFHVFESGVHRISANFDSCLRLAQSLNQQAAPVYAGAHRELRRLCQKMIAFGRRP